MQRQYIIFIAAAAAAFAALIGLAYYNPFQQSGGEDDADVIKAKKGQEVHIRYSSNVVKLIQDLPNKNGLEAQVSSELQVANLAGVRGEIRYADMTITYVQDGEEETVTAEEFKTIEYRFFPDPGNKTKYLYENVDYIAKAEDSQVIVTVKPLSSADVGERYTVKLILHTGGAVGYAINEKVVEIVA